MKKNIYIETIKYAEERLQQKEMTRIENLREFLESKGYHIPDSNFLSALFLEVFGTQQMRNGGYYSDPGYLNSDAYFKLLEYEELKHARETAIQAQENATRAFKLSKWAFVVSAGLAFISIILSIIGINADPTIKFDNQSLTRMLELTNNGQTN